MDIEELLKAFEPGVSEDYVTKLDKESLNKICSNTGSYSTSYLLTRFL